MLISKRLTKSNRLVLMAALLVSSASCGKPEADGTGPRPSSNPSVVGYESAPITEEPAETDRDGLMSNMPIPIRADEVATVQNSSFGRDKIACNRSKSHTARQIWDIVRRALSVRQSPRLIGYGSKDLEFADGSGKAIVLTYTFSPGDPGVLSKSADYFLVNGDCQVLLFKSETDLP